MKDSKKKQKIIITKRDEKLFRYLFVNKVATVEDIRQDIFENVSIKTVHRRLIKLSKENYLDATFQREFGNRLVYFLTKKAFIKYIADLNMMKRVQLKSDSINHDLTLLKIKRKFKDLKMVQGFYSENLIKSGIMDDVLEIKRLKEIRPDAIIKVKMNERILYLPLEYEASSKYSKRNDQLLTKYYTNPYVPAVLFISKSESIEKRIYQKEIKNCFKDNGKFYYSLLENVLKAKSELSFTSITKEVLSIN